MAKLRLFTYSGDSYLGMVENASGDEEGIVSVDSPVKVTFTYENANESSAKLTWLLTPVMPAVLLADGKKNTVGFNKDLICFSTTLTSSKDFNADLTKAYKSLTNEEESQ